MNRFNMDLFITIFKFYIIWRKNMSKLLIVSIILCLFLLESTSALGSILNNEPKVRITDFGVPLLKCGNPIKVGDKFDVTLTLTNERLLFRCNSEIRIYLTCAGICLKEIGREEIIIHPRTPNENYEIECEINELDANSIQEKYNLRAILYEHKTLGGLIERDCSTIESVNIVTKFWEKDKIKIMKFRPPDIWPEETKGQLLSTTANEKENLYVTVKNDGGYNFSVLVRIDMIDTPLMDVPLVEIEGLGEERKEIGRTTYFLHSGEEKELDITCYLNKADREKKNFNVQAVLFTDIDGKLYHVETSTTQTIKVELNDLDEIKENVFQAWLVFVGIIISLLLIAVLIKIIWPLMRGRPVKATFEISKKERPKNKKKK